MAKITTKNQEKLQQEKVEESVSKVELFFNENKKKIWGILCAILAIALVILAYNHFVRQPKIREAQAESFQAEKFFREGSFEQALKGDGDMMGFEQLAQEYGNKAGESVYLYAGLCNLQLGNWEEALSWLNQYSGSETILAARAIAAQGDAYCGLEQFENALAKYEKAARYANNAYSAEYLLKAAEVAEHIGNTTKALELYKEIKDQYPGTVQGTMIDKYITRLENSLEK